MVHIEELKKPYARAAFTRFAVPNNSWYEFWQLSQGANKFNKEYWETIISEPTLFALSVGIRICLLSFLQRSKTSALRDVLSMTLNCIRWWGSSLGALGNVEYPCIATTSGVSSIDQRDLFKNYSYSKEPYAKASCKY